MIPQIRIHRICIISLDGLVKERDRKQQQQNATKSSKKFGKSSAINVLTFCRLVVFFILEIIETKSVLKNRKTTNSNSIFLDLDGPHLKVIFQKLCFTEKIVGH